MKNRNPNLEALRIDPTMCQVIAICTHIATNPITFDSRGYPIIPVDELTENQLKVQKTRSCQLKIFSKRSTLHAQDLSLTVH